MAKKLEDVWAVAIAHCGVVVLTAVLWVGKKLFPAKFAVGCEDSDEPLTEPYRTQWRAITPRM